MDNERELTQCGKFGYETINFNKGKIIIPYIYRADGKYCATKIFSWHFDCIQAINKSIIINPHLIDFGYLHGYDMHREEACLMNEINHWHNNSMYPYTFYQHDTIVKLEDVRDIFNYIDDITEKLKFRTSYRMHGGSMLWLWLPKSKQTFVLPYVTKNAQRFVPVHNSLASNNVPLNVTKLTGIDVMYMRFLLDTLSVNVPSQQFELPCVYLDDFVAHLVANEDGHYEYDDNYWPTKISPRPKDNNNVPFFSSTVSNKINSPSNQQNKVPMKRKQKSPSIEVKMPKQDEPVVISTEQKTDEPKSPKEDKMNKKLPKTTTKKQKVDEETFYEVNKLVDYKMKKDGTETVRIRWKGYKPKDDTWEPVSFLSEDLKKDVKPFREKWARKTNAKG